MKKLLLTLALLLAPVAASAQCNGVFPNNTACGNITGANNTPRPIPLSSFPAATPGGTNGQIQYNNSGAFGGFTMSGDCTTNTTTGAIACTPFGRLASPNAWTSTNTWSNTSTFNGDVYMGSGRPWADVRAYGATGNGSTDDTTAFQSALTALGAGGGILNIPPGTYCLKTAGGVTVSTSTRLVGAGAFTSIVSACGVDTNVLTLNAPHATAEHLFIIGKGQAADTFGATQDALTIGASCTECFVYDSYALFGRFAANIIGSDATFLKFTATQAYGPAMIENQSTGGNFFIRCKFDQGWPGTIPTIGASVPAWIASHAYALNAVVTSGGYIIQNTQAGTSAGVAPTLRNYNLTITDNTARWTLVAPASYQGMEISGATSQNTLTQCDFTGAFTNGISVVAAVQNLFIDQTYFGQHLSAGIATSAAGQSLSVTGSNIIGGVLSGGVGISVGATWVSDTIIVANHFTGAFFNSALGISVNGGVRTSINGNTIQNFATAGVSIGANVTDFVINGNIFGATTSAVTVVAGTSNYYNITNNVTHGVAISDNGTGVNKTLSGNN